MGPVLGLGRFLGRMLGFRIGGFGARKGYQQSNIPHHPPTEYLLCARHGLLHFSQTRAYEQPGPDARPPPPSPACP